MSLMSKALPFLNVGTAVLLLESKGLLNQDLRVFLEKLPQETKLSDIPGEKWVELLGIIVNSTWNGGAGDNGDVANHESKPVVVQCKHCKRINYYD